MRRRRPFGPQQRHRRRQRFERLRRAGHRRLQQQVGGIHATQLFGAGVDVNQLLLRPRRFDQRVAAGRHLAQARADREDQVGIDDALGELRIDADAHVAGVVRMAVVEQVLEAKRTAHRQIPAFGKTLQRVAGFGVPAAAARDDERALRRQQHRPHVAQRAGRGPGERGFDPQQHRRRRRLRQHVFGQRQHHRPRAPLQCGVEGACDVFGQPIGVVHLADPLRKTERAGAEHLTVVDLLKCFAVALVARDLADEQDHRRAVLKSGVQPDAGIGRTRPAGHEADARAPGELALCIGHERGTAFLSASDEADAFAVLVKAVEHGQKTFAGNTEHGVDALGDQSLDQRVAREAFRRSGGHGNEVSRAE